MKKIVLAIATAMHLAGCGADWMPEQLPAGSRVIQQNVEITDVGTLIASAKVGDRNYTITTTKGAFSTYTSLVVPYQTPVSMEKYTDPDNGQSLGTVLLALQHAVLVREILALVK